MKSVRRFTLLAACAAIAVVPAAAHAQRQQATPEQRINRLERQVEQMQRQVFPRGRPADTAGFAGEPAATQSSVVTLDQRLDAVERQMADMLRQAEENNHRLQTIQADLAKLRSDQEQRIGALEQRLNDAAAAGTAVTQPAAEPTPKPTSPKPPKGTTATAATPAPAPAAASAAPEGDPGEDAYTEGFHLWEAGNYDQAINALRAFTSAYPKHRRVSYANNLIGRALLDKGQPRAAAEALLANYRSNPSGERAPDSLYYLGQALMKLGQPTQACKAYQELDAVYGAKVRPDLKKLESDAKTQAQCS
ncbi:MAG TPA: tetratricopeptide repeat protein [Sphingomicrobium sp.]|nr:tetratricopeptide repeat protein [Sphingomicrobium sp.]